MTKYVFVAGGIISSLGRDTVTSSLGCLLKDRDLKVTIQKFDPHINIDPGTMNPYQCGEVLVTDDSTEADLDLGRYERFVDMRTSKYLNVTTGKIYSEVLKKKRRDDYQGTTVQVIPHITNVIKGKIMRTGQTTDSGAVILETGDTIGDVESTPFVETICQTKHGVSTDNVMYIHVTLVPYLHAAHETKTKPTQRSIVTLRSIGIRPNMLVLRAEEEVRQELENKIANFIDVPVEAIMESIDAPSLSDIPLNLQEQGIGQLVCDHFKLAPPKSEADVEEWVKLEKHPTSLKYKIKITLVGKYVELEDACISVTEALRHVGCLYSSEIRINKVRTEDITEDNIIDFIEDSDGSAVPGGFGLCGLEGMTTTIECTHEDDTPFPGICLRMQMATVELARDVLGYKDTNTTEADLETKNNIISLMADQEGQDTIDGTLRLGLYPARFKKDTKTHKAYDEQEIIQERHRHRYEFDNRYREELEKYGTILDGVFPDNHLVEIVKTPDKKFLTAAQYHPEFLSRPHKPEGPFKAFIGIASGLEEGKF